MKIRFLIIVIFTLSIITPLSLFAQEPINCNFGDRTTSLDSIFEKDLAVKTFTEKHPNATRYVTIEESQIPNGELSFTAKNNNANEVLLIEFTLNENECYRPKHYVYSYDNGVINATVRNSLSNFTEVMNLIKLDDKKIEDFYTKNCNPISLDYTVEDNSEPYFCKSDHDNVIQMYLQKYVGGPIEIHIPDKTMDALFYNCDLNGYFFVLNSGEEIDFDLVAENGKRVFKMELPPGYSKIEIIGFVDLSGTADHFCGSILGSNSKYISPLLQAKIGVEPHRIQCNDGLNLLLKPTEFTKPACVTNKTADVLSHREGWSIVLSEDQYRDW